jgi:methyl-accepting chemotaxis protein
MRDMSSSAQATARDVQVMTRANREQAAAATRLVGQLDEIRRITDRNSTGVRRTRGGTADLLKRAEALTGLMNGALRARSGGNGRARR